MKPTLCSRCKKNLAVVFITKIDGGKTVNEGLCLKCAKEMGIKPVDDMIERMGLSEDDLENLNGEMTEAMNGLESLLSQGHDAEDGSEDDEADSEDLSQLLNMVFSPDADADIMLGTAAPAKHHFEDDELIGGASDDASANAGGDVINEDLGSLDDLLSQVVKSESSDEE